MTFEVQHPKLSFDPKTHKHTYACALIHTCEHTRAHTTFWASSSLSVLYEAILPRLLTCWGQDCLKHLGMIVKIKIKTTKDAALKCFWGYDPTIPGLLAEQTPFKHKLLCAPGNCKVFQGNKGWKSLLGMHWDNWTQLAMKRWTEKYASIICRCKAYDVLSVQCLNITYRSRVVVRGPNFMKSVYEVITNVLLLERKQKINCCMCFHFNVYLREGKESNKDAGTFFSN